MIGSPVAGAPLRRAGFGLARQHGFLHLMLAQKHRACQAGKILASAYLRPEMERAAPRYDRVQSLRVNGNAGHISACSVSPVFETGDPRYDWLDHTRAVGKGRLARSWPRRSYRQVE